MFSQLRFKLWLLQPLCTSRQPQSAGSTADGNYRVVKRGFVFTKNTKGPHMSSRTLQSGQEMNHVTTQFKGQRINSRQNVRASTRARRANL